MARQFKPGQLQTGSLYNISASYALTASHADSVAHADAAGTIDLYSFGSDIDSYVLLSNVIATNGVAVGGDSDLRYNASKNKLTVGSISATSLTGSLLGTASYAMYAETASLSDRTTQIDVFVKNQSGYNIAKGVVVRITGSNNSSDIPRIVTASFENDNNSANTLGITREAISNGSEGYIITEGVLIGIDTTNYTSGQLIYLGANGSITGSAPIAPLHAVRLGEVVRHQSNNGSIYVRIDNGYEIDELHNVLITNTTAGDLLFRSGSVWINSKQLSGSYALTGSLSATQITASNLYAGATYITGSLTVIGNSQFIGSASFLYVTSSQLALSSSFISVNVFEPLERFGGLKVYDSGSSSATASLAWDSLNNRWIYQNASGSTYSGGMLLSGPRNTGSLGNEPSLTRWFVARSDGGDHLNDTQIYSSASITQITGSLTVTAGITGSLQGSSSYALTASYLDNYVAPFPYTGSALITGSLGVTGSLSVLEAGVTSLNTATYTLRGVNGNLSVDWDGRRLYDGSATTAVNWRLRTLSDGAKDSADWSSRKLLDTGGTNSALNWGSRLAYDSNATQSIDWQNRTLKNNIGTTVLDWQNATFTGSLLGTASYASASISASYALTASYSLTTKPAGGEGSIQFSLGGTTLNSSANLVFNTSSKSLLQGNLITAPGLYSHAEGALTLASGSYSHAEGRSTNSSGSYSHAEGKSTISIGAYSHTEGHITTTVGSFSHAEGSGTSTYGAVSHAEGENSITGNPNGYVAAAVTPGIVELDTSYGDLTSQFIPGQKIGIDDYSQDNSYSYAVRTIQSCSFSAGKTNIYLVDINFQSSVVYIVNLDIPNSGTYTVGGVSAHAEGVNTIANGYASHADGNGVTYGNYSHAEGQSTYAWGDAAHAEGNSANAYGGTSHAEGAGTYSIGAGSHSEGRSTIAGFMAYENNGTAITAGVFKLHSKYGNLTSTLTTGVFIILYDTNTSTTKKLEIASSIYNLFGETEITLVDTSIDTNGDYNYIIGVYDNAFPTFADAYAGEYSHTSGFESRTIGAYSAAEGYATRALGYFQSVVGQFNVPVSQSAAFIVGDGVDDNNRHNLVVAASGNVTISGSLRVQNGVSGSFSGDGSGLTGVGGDSFPYTGSAIISGSLQITGSLSVTQTINATASYAVTASYVDISALPIVSPIGAYTTLTSSVNAGSNIMLPNGLTYVSSSIYEYISVAVNGLLLRYNIDFIPTSTASIQFNITVPSGSEMSYRSYRRP